MARTNCAPRRNRQPSSNRSAIRPDDHDERRQAEDHGQLPRAIPEAVDVAAIASGSNGRPSPGRVAATPITSEEGEPDRDPAGERDRDAVPESARPGSRPGRSGTLSAGPGCPARARAKARIKNASTIPSRIVASDVDTVMARIAPGPPSRPPPRSGQGESHPRLILYPTVPVCNPTSRDRHIARVFFCVPVAGGGQCWTVNSSRYRAWSTVATRPPGRVLPARPSADLVPTGWIIRRWSTVDHAVLSVPTSLGPRPQISPRPGRDLPSLAR